MASAEDLNTVCASVAADAAAEPSLSQPTPDAAQLPQPVSVTASPVPRPADELDFAAAEPLAATDIADLSSAQQHALIALSQGRGASDAARAAGVCRATIYNWHRNDPAFIAALNIWRMQGKQQIANQMMALRNQAMAVVMEALKKGEFRAAIKVLEHIEKQEFGPGTKKEVAARLKQRNRVTFRREVDAATKDEEYDKRRRRLPRDPVEAAAERAAILAAIKRAYPDKDPKQVKIPMGEHERMEMEFRKQLKKDHAPWEFPEPHGDPAW